MRQINVEIITQHIADMCCEVNFNLGKDVLSGLKEAFHQEHSPVGREVLHQLIENTDISFREKIPLCQDTGFAVVFLEVGQEVVVVGGDLEEAINEGVREGYQRYYLRKSIVKDPLRRENTEDNTPAVIHYDIVPGDTFKITFVSKGGGSENMSRVKMLKPAEGERGIIDFVLETVNTAGANACPPIVVGVGIGGTFETCTLLAKKALLRPLNQPNKDKYYADLEGRILEDVNHLGIGPQGFGGSITALAVHIEFAPTHIACLPAAVNLNCHASRHLQRIL
ncbi:fumarate hydratase [Candidatus Contubernalis alkaliaceticus]|uniref:fumarate hydratase n=1 Tax=Candidatus Contubernalis alkaliaceticus TaxID=338645 RepID=UPI001F4BED1A|nr:fumarate hydratase [Candidatus Contubernalis alkalaceticus]UNC91595.1 fumarate hydratase [Candidatus Contubernalis alkalaceticus]